MKMIINFSLDEEVVRELKKEKNRSSLINAYLLNYYNINLNKVPEEIEEPKTIKEETEEDLEEVFGEQPK